MPVEVKRAQIFTKKVVELEGIPELIANAKRLSYRLKEDGATVYKVKGALMKGGLMVRDYARETAPVYRQVVIRKGKRIEPGAFRRSIFVAYGKPDQPIIFGCNYKIAPHAWLVEFGSKNTQPHHTLRNAIVARRREAIAVMADGLREVIKEAAEQ